MLTCQECCRRIACIGVVACVSLLLPGCGAGSAKSRAESSLNLKVLGMAIITYKEENDGRWPDKLSDVQQQAEKAAADMGVDQDFAALMKNPLTGADPGYEYIKPSEGDALDTTVLLYQLRDGKRDESLPVCYQSGSVQ